MASALSELRFTDLEMLPGRIVNVAAHASLQLDIKYLKQLDTEGLHQPDGKAPKWFRRLETVIEERARNDNKPVPSVHLNVTRIAVLGDIGMELNAARFGAGQVRIEIPVPHVVAGRVNTAATQVITVLVFDSGKLIFTGGENEFVTQLAAWQFVLMLTTRFDIPATLSCFRINNIVFNFFLNFHVDLRRMQAAEGILCKYDPVEFPAVVYKFGEKFKALVNYTGRVIITGARDRATAHEAYVGLYAKLRDYRMEAGAPRDGARRIPYASAEERTDSYMRMNQQFTTIMQTFSGEGELEAIDRAAPELRLGQFLETCAKRMQALPAPSERPRKRKHPE